MSDDFDDVSLAQQVLLKFQGDEPARVLKQFIELIELMKIQYPQL